MNKKGLTVVELLAVVVLISVITVLIAPNYLKQLQSGKEKLTEINKKQIEDTAKIIVDEILMCDLSDDLKNMLSKEKCSDLKSLILSDTGLTVNIKELEDYHFLDNKVSEDKCSSSDKENSKINIKVDESTYKVSVDLTEVKCNF